VELLTRPRIFHGSVNAMRIDRPRVWSLLGACVGSFVVLGSSMSGSAHAQAIALQLPTFSFFATDSSVLVPDRGAVMLGGVSRSSSGSNQVGPTIFPSPRSYGASQGASFSSVTVQIHDMDEMDRAVLARANASRSPRSLTPAAQLAGMHGAAAAPEDNEAPVASVAELLARKASAAAQEHEGARLEAKAREALAAGHTGVAKVYLQMAARRATGSEKSRILAQIQAIDPKSPVAAAR
jgi:hypothetical protein